MYRNAKGLIKINGTLTAPFRYDRGVRQADSPTGSLFTLIIEPLVLMCDNTLRDYGLPVPSSSARAYADITEERGRVSTSVTTLFGL
jgi:hypothetical protein